ncbi:MAG: urocanate hydratase [Chitinophagales bacterium]|nr:urocanate hydratase [Bacteroidota bacterium]MCB9043927.1 urocanate hydratase [Chitinophagales bacterium]
MTHQNELRYFQEQILIGIPDELPPAPTYDTSVNHAPKRDISILTPQDKKLAVRNALRYFSPKHHAVLAKEFAQELEQYGRIYMYRFRPDYAIKARPLHEFPHQSLQAASIMLMISNNLSKAVAQHPHELITYGGNGTVFQNWAQYRLCMQYLATMTNHQTLVMYSGHPLGLFPSQPDSPRVIVTNGMMIPNFSKDQDWNKYNALGVTQYGQMTAGSYMYIGPQGIVHGTTITILNAGRKISHDATSSQVAGKLFISSGLGGMSGAQAKAAEISGVVGIIAEINPKAVQQRVDDGYVKAENVYSDLANLMQRAEKARQAKEAVALIYLGNIVDLWEYLAEKNIKVDLGSDQTSLHNPWQGGYYPAGIDFEAAQTLIFQNPAKFKEKVEASLVRQVAAINKLTANGMYFFDYGNAFLKQAADAKADVCLPDGNFRYPSYVQDIMGPMCFDYGFGPFRWVCCSNDPKDLETTDLLAEEVLKKMLENAPTEIQQQLHDNIRWIAQAKANKLVAGSQARILYADAEGRIRIARAFNDAIAQGKISAPVVLGRDHHDVSGTDSPYRETANIYDGSQFTADMAVHNVIGDAFRGATWVSLHNGGGVGWGNVINGGFGLTLDGSATADKHLENMLFWDVNNGIARRSWARNDGAIFAIRRAMEIEPQLKVTMPNIADDALIDGLW